MDDFRIKIGAELDKNAGKQIQDGLNKVTPKPIEVPFEIDFKNSKEIENEMKRIVSNLTNGKGELANFKIDTSTIFDKDLNKRVEKINSAIIKYKNELGEVISEQYKFNKIGSEMGSDGKEEAIMGWSKAMSTYGQNIEQATKKEEALAKKQQASMMKQKELVEQMKLLQIQTNKSGTTLDQDNLTGFDTANKNNNIKEMTHYLKLAKTEYSQLNAMMEKDLPISGLENMKKNIGTMPIDIQNVETSFKKLQVQPEELRTRIDQLGNSFKSLDSFKGAEADKVKQYNLLKGEIIRVTKEVKSLIVAQQQQVSLDDKTKFSSSITSWSNDNTKGAKLFRVELERIQRELVGADKTKFTALKKEFGSIQKQTEAMGKSGRTAFQELGNNFKKFASWYGIAGITTGAVRGIKQMVSTVVELDKSLVDLQQATGFTAEETGKLLNTYIDLGQELGATGTEVAQAADVWLRQGKSIAETNELIKDSMMLSKIGQIDSATATQYLTSAMKGYKLEVSEVLNLIDQMSAIDISSATDIGGLAEAMSRTAASADLAGVSVQKLLGYLATVGEVTQKEMSSIGESFKTIFARMGNVKLGSFIDEDGNDITTELNDVEKILNKVDIKLRDSATSFRDFDKVLDDVGGSWNTFSEVEQSAIATTFAGVRQRENFIVLMENYANSLKYTEIATNSAGTAMEKFSAYEESVEAKTKRLQSSLQELAVGTLNSSVVKGFLDFANVAVNATTAIGGLVPVVATLGIAFGVHKFLLPILVKEMSALLLVETGVTATTMSQIVAQTGLNGAVTLGTTAIRANTTALLAWMATNPVGWILALGTALIGVTIGITKLYDHLNVTAEEMAESHAKSVQKVADLSAEYDKLTSSLSELETQQKSVKTQLKDLYELRKNQTITDAEKEYLEQLESQNTKLEKQIEYEKVLQDIEGKKAEQPAIEVMSEKSQMSIHKSTGINGVATPYKVTDAEKIKENTVQIKALNQEMQNYNDVISGNSLPIEQQEKYNKQLEYYKEILADGSINQDQYDAYTKETEALLNGTLTFEDYTKKMEEFKATQGGYISENATAIESLQLLNDKIVSTSGANYDLKVANQAIIDGAKESATAFGELSGELGTVANAISTTAEAIKESFNQAFNTQSFSEYRDELIALSRAGELSEETLSSTSRYNYLLNETGLTAEALIKLIKEISDKPITLDEGIREAEYAMKNLAIITDAINKKQKLTDDQVLDLISHYPELEKSLIRTTNGWYLEKAALDTVGISATNLQSAYLTAQKAMNDMLADGVKGRLEKYKIELDGITTIAQAYQEINKEMKNQTNNGAVVKGGKVVGYWSGSEAEKVYQESTKYAEAILALNEGKLKLEKLQNSLGKSSTKIGSTSTKTKSESSKFFDWLSISIEKSKQKAQSAIDSIANQISYKAKNAKINIAVKAKIDEKSSLKTIQNAYNKMASDVKLSKKYRDLVNNGGMNVETIKDEKLANKIEEYTKFKDAANEVGKSIKEINNEIKELRLQKLDNIKSYFDSKSSIAESRISKRESEISLKEAKGGSATKGDYNYLIDRQKTLKKNAEDEYKAYEKTFNNLVKKNKIDIGSPEWREGVVYLEELETQINECDIAIEGFKTNISELTWDNIDDGIAESSKLTDKLELLASQIKDDELFDFDEDGNIEGMSEKGIAKLTLYQSAIESSKKKIKKLNSAIDKLNKQYKNNKNDAKYIERLEELESKLIDTTQSMKSYADSISDVMNSKRDAEIESINKKISKYQELINARKKDLQEQRDAKKYKDTIDDATGEISKIEKRIAELQSAVNSGDREAIAELKKANDELAEKKKALADTQYDHEIELAEKALDESAEQYEKNMNTQIDTLNSYYDTQEERIKMAAQLTKNSFTDAWKTISQIASESNIRITNDFKKLISSTISSLNSSNSTSVTPSNVVDKGSVAALLGVQKESNKKVDQSKLSALNKYLSYKGYGTLNTNQMVLLAQHLGLTDINSTELLGSNEIGRENKKRILKALQVAKFSTGGYVDASMIKATGEDGLALVKHGEPILTVEQGKLFKELIDNIKPLNNLTKLARPNMSNIINNNRTTPIENNTYLTINGDASELTVQQLKKYGSEITEIVSKELVKFNK